MKPKVEYRVAKSPTGWPYSYHKKLDNAIKTLERATKFGHKKLKIYRVEISQVDAFPVPLKSCVYLRK